MERGGLVDVAGLPGASDAFVGRTEPLATLAHRAELATMDAARSVMVTGPAGIGKSRLCAELSAHLQATGDSGWSPRPVGRTAARPPLWALAGPGPAGARRQRRRRGGARTRPR